MLHYCKKKEILSNFANNTSGGTTYPGEPLCMYKIVYVHNYCVYTGNTDDYCNFGLEGITLKGFNRFDGPGGTN